MSTEMKCKILKMLNTTQASGKPKKGEINYEEKLFLTH